MNLSRTYVQNALNTQSIKVPRKNDLVLVGTHETSAGVAVNITGATMKFTVVNRLTGYREFQKTVGSGIVLTTPASGVFTLTLSETDLALDAGDYDYDLEITLSSHTATIGMGTFRVYDIYSDVAAAS